MQQNDRVKAEKAILVGLSADCFRPEENATDESLDELEALLETAGGICEAKVLQNRHTPDPHSFIGEGKAQEVRTLLESTGATLVVFDNDLSPSQIRALEELTGCDRPGPQRPDIGYLCPARQNGRGPPAGRAGAVSVPAAEALRHGHVDVPPGRRHRHARPRRNEARNGPPPHPRAHHPPAGRSWTRCAACAPRSVSAA